VRRSLALTTATLATALVAIALACGTHPLLVGTIAADAGRTPCDTEDAGDGGGQFCSTTCGSKSGFFESTHSLDCSAYGPECGCDGINYYNRCVRQEARISLKSEGPCELSLGCMDARCKPAHGACAFVLAEFPFPPVLPAEYLEPACKGNNQVFQSAIDAGFLAESCWALPESCPDSGAPLVRRCVGGCVDECVAIRTNGPSGDPYYSCEPDASAD
jgi:hypothetical protein